MLAKRDPADGVKPRAFGERRIVSSSLSGSYLLMIPLSMRFRFKAAMSLHQSPLATSSGVGSGGGTVRYSSNIIAGVGWLLREFLPIDSLVG